MAKGKFHSIVSVFCVAVVSASCRKQLQPPTELKSNEDTTFCSVPQMSDFERHLSDVEQKSTLQAALAKSKLNDDGESIVGTSSKDALVRWILVTLTPLSMGCKNYEAGGAQKYGEKSYANFVATAVDALRPDSRGGLVPAQDDTLKNLNLSQAQMKFVGILLALNRRIRDDQNATFRTAGQDVIHGIPLTPKEDHLVNEISREGLLKVVTYERPFKNASGDLVSGRFLHYPTGADVLKHIVGLAAVFEKAQSKSDQQYQDDAARMMRRCITIHPFQDANGRTCTLAASWMQSKRKLPHSVLWSGEDVLLKEQEFVLRYQKGVQFHQEFRRGFK